LQNGGVFYWPTDIEANVEAGFTDNSNP